MSNDTSYVLGQADALMRRHRAYLAEPATPLTSPSAEEDVPILTDVVSDAQLANTLPHMQHHLDALREELNRWLSEELPHAVLKVTDGLADQLMGELTHQAEKHLLPRLLSRLDGSQPAHPPLDP